MRETRCCCSQGGACVAQHSSHLRGRPDARPSPAQTEGSATDADMAALQNDIAGTILHNVKMKYKGKDVTLKPLEEA